jgi:hypothetical protein
MTRPDRRSFVAAIAASIATPVGLGAKECPTAGMDRHCASGLGDGAARVRAPPWLLAWGRKEDDFDVI